MSTLSSVGATAPQSGQSISIVQIAMANSHVSFVHVFSALVPFHALITSLLEVMSALLVLPVLHYEGTRGAQKGP